MSFPLVDQYAHYIMGLGAVLILIGFLTWLVQKFSLFGTSRTKEKDSVSLKLLSSLQLDPKRRLVVVEFNKRKHLLLLGNSSETLIESEDLASSYPSQNRKAPNPADTDSFGQKAPSSTIQNKAGPDQITRPFSFQKNPPPLQDSQDRKPPLPKELRP